MLRIGRAITLFGVCITFSACSVVDTQNLPHRGTTQWDFDHHIQFKQTTLTDKYFQLEIIPNKQVRFEKLATFLLRKSYDLCGGYHYKIEMIQGIEGFDDKRAMPNYIFPSLIAKIEC